MNLVYNTIALTVSWTRLQIVNVCSVIVGLQHSLRYILCLG